MRFCKSLQPGIKYSNPLGTTKCCSSKLKSSLWLYQKCPLATSGKTFWDTLLPMTSNLNCFVLYYPRPYMISSKHFGSNVNNTGEHHFGSLRSDTCFWLTPESENEFFSTKSSFELQDTLAFYKNHTNIAYTNSLYMQ